MLSFYKTQLGIENVKEDSFIINVQYLYCRLW